MKKIKLYLRNIPRKARICLNILLIVLLLFVSYILLDCPALTPVQQFRRVEKANLVGPSEIIEIIDLPNGLDDHLLVADDSDGVILYLFNDFEYRWAGGDYFLYREKSQGITVLPAPTHTHFGSDSYVMDIPVLVFHDYPNATRAELELSIGEGLGVQETRWEEGGEVHIEYFEKTYLMYADTGLEGYFRFNLHAQSENWYVDENGQNRGTLLGNEGLALQTLCRMMSHNRAYLQQYVDAVVRLYDAENKLITEEYLTLRSVNGQRYAQEQ